MFEIIYTLKSLTEDVNEIIKSNETEIRYNLFLGSFRLKKDNEYIIFDWDWIPLLDFSLCLNEIKDKLLHKSTKEIFDFTENSEIIDFIRINNQIQICFQEEKMFINISEFTFAINSFYNKLIDDIIKKYLLILNNIHFEKLTKQN